MTTKYKKYIESTLWSSGLLYIFFIINFIGQVILARLLAPDDFGIIVLSLSIVEILKIFFGFSVSMAYIRMKDSSTLYGTAMFLGLLGWIGMIVSVLIFYYPISIIFGSNIAFFVLLISFFSIFVYLSYIIEADLEKKFNFKKSSFIVGISSFIGMFSAVIFAYYGYEEKSLLLREIISPIVLFYLSIKMTNKKISFDYNKKELKEMFLFVYKMLFSRGAEILYMKFPLVLISSLSGSTSLGLISQMLYLAQLPAVALGPIATKVSYVFYSHHQDDKEIQNKGRNIISLLLLILSIPISFIFYFYSVELLLYLWGEKWIEASPYLKQLAIFTLLYPVFTNLKTYLYSNAKNSIVTKSFLFGFTCLFLSIVFLSKEYLGVFFSVSMMLMLFYQIYVIRKMLVN